VALRRRKKHAVSVAVQVLIVYGQALRAYDVVVACRDTRSYCDRVEAGDLDEMREEVRSLANMVLVTSPSLFDDPDARLFLKEVQRLVAAIYVVVALAPRYPTAAGPTRERCFSPEDLQVSSSSTGGSLGNARACPRRTASCSTRSPISWAPRPTNRSPLGPQIKEPPKIQALATTVRCRAAWPRSYTPSWPPAAEHQKKPTFRGTS
jgi:hypothetical protein